MNHKFADKLLFRKGPLSFAAEPESKRAPYLPRVLTCFGGDLTLAGAAPFPGLEVSPHFWQQFDSLGTHCRGTEKPMPCRTTTVTPVVTNLRNEFLIHSPSPTR